MSLESKVNELDNISSKSTITLWHGAKYGLEGKPDVKHNSGRLNDFGFGFYCNTLKTMANDWALKGDVPELYEILLPTNCSILRISDVNEWLLYIGFCRGLWKNVKNISINDLPHYDEIMKADVLVGLIADDNVVNQLPKFFNNEISLDTIKEQLMVANFGSQYVIKSQEVLDKCNIKQIDLVSRERIYRVGLREELDRIEKAHMKRTDEAFFRDINSTIFE